MKILACLFLSLAYSFCITSDYWAYQNSNIVLKKDQYFSARVKHNGVVKILHFKWTLHIADVLTMVVNYDRFNHQVILHKRNRSYKIPLFRKKPPYIENPYAIIKFLEFNEYNQSSKFQLLIRDEQQNTRLE